MVSICSSIDIYVWYMLSTDWGPCALTLPLRASTVALPRYPHLARLNAVVIARSSLTQPRRQAAARLAGQPRCLGHRPQLAAQLASRISLGRCGATGSMRKAVILALLPHVVSGQLRCHGSLSWSGHQALVRWVYGYRKSSQGYNCILEMVSEPPRWLA